ncbi:endonuclease/exonuclease/phosphatase family protein [Nonomuraea sp. NPDC059007]|uniref:endonuclease/exonuclease/phosphatase family protein n=1 Tax=Nonomuraea sp. NPDC059007 TaxID=3346692 RepID=UPI0036AA035C
MRLLPLLAAALLAMTAVTVPARAAAPDGTLALESNAVRAGDPIRLSYSTPRPHAQNWVGLYTEPGNGPVAEQFVGPSLKWVYTPDANGTASLPTQGLEPGDYVVYYLAQDGYAWLAQPARLRLVSSAAPHFVTSPFTLRNGRAGTPYGASVTGLVKGDTSGLTFTKKAGAAWIAVAADGRVSGTPTAAGTSALTVEARNAAGQTSTASVSIRVRGASETLVPRLKAMSWNLWHGGSQVSGGREKQLRFLLDRDVDVVGLQETSSTSARELAQALGWDHFQAGADLGIISRYPITARGPLPSQSGLAGIYARVRLDERTGRELVLWNAHLGYTPYGPYDACFSNRTTQQLLTREADSGRTGQIQAIIQAMGGHLQAAGTHPVLLTGDFNAPSHLDYTAAAAPSHCGRSGIPWPTSKLPEQAGLKDSYRVARPNPVTAPGNTWSPVYKTFTGGYGYDHRIGDPEPQDRIDFVHYAGGLSVESSDAVVAGTPAPHPGHGGNEWTSDHAAVLTTFTLT